MLPKTHIFKMMIYVNTTSTSFCTNKKKQKQKNTYTLRKTLPIRLFINKSVLSKLPAGTPLASESHFPSTPFSSCFKLKPFRLVHSSSFTSLKSSPNLLFIYLLFFPCWTLPKIVGTHRHPQPDSFV